MDTVAGTVEITNKESWHQTIWREAAFISAGTGSAGSYPQAEPPAQQGRAFHTFTTGLWGVSTQEPLQWKILGHTIGVFKMLVIF